MKTFSKNNPFFEISKPSESGRYIPVYRSEVKRKYYSCVFKQFAIPVHSLVTTSLDDPIRVTFYDYKNNKPPKTISNYKMSVCQFMETIRTPYEFLNDSQNCGNFWFQLLPNIKKWTSIEYDNDY